MEKVRIGELCQMQSGGTPSRKSSVFWENGTIPWAKISDLETSNDGYVYSTEELITEKGLQSINNRFFKKGTLLLAMYGSVGKTAITGIDLTTNQAILGINIKDVERLDINYLRYWFQSIKEKLLNRAVGVALMNISLGIVKDLEIPLPSLSEQKSIAAKLDKADEIRRLNQQLIGKYDALTQSLFLDMFGDPVKNEKGFLKVLLKEQCKIKGGKRVPKGESLIKENTGFPYIKAGNIKNGKVTTKDLEFLLPETQKKIKNYIVDEGDVCITVVGANIGDIGIVPKELHKANLTENANKILVKNQEILDSKYLAFYLQMEFVQKNISKKTMAVGVPKLALFRIEELELLLPPIQLQNQFAERIEKIEAQKQLAQDGLAKSEALFQRLLQEAFVAPAPVTSAPLSDRNPVAERSRSQRSRSQR
ncbi:MAG: restriction endonuclease subunit S [Chryseobacterium sp.]|nr:restriction endonuclease subunit S [Chryseobacterium sp.]